MLVHGLGGNGPGNFAYIGPALASNGYCAFSLTYGVNHQLGPLFAKFGGLLPMEQSAAELGAFVDRVRQTTGAAKVDIVGHSEGSLMPNYYVKFLGGDSYVDHYVGITPLWQGSQLLGLHTLADLGRSSGFTDFIMSLFPQGGCPACLQVLAGSPFLQKLNSGGGPAVPGVSYTMLMTRLDETVVPYTSGVMHGPEVTNIVVQDQCPLDLSGHIGMAFDANVVGHIFNALDPAHAQPVACALAPVIL